MFGNSRKNFSGDKEVILEVIENLLSNAFRYAKTKVEMEAFLTSSELQIRNKKMMEWDLQ